MLKKILIIVLIFFGYLAKAQVDTYSRQIIDSIIIYKDSKHSNIFYYAPEKLQLSLDKSGKPDFQLLKMRYVGTNCSNDVNESRTTNLVKLRIKMPVISTEKLKHIRAELHKTVRQVKLKPLPINKITSELLIPMKDVTDTTKVVKKSIGKTRASSADSKEGLSTGKSFWTERIFTFSLTDNETILLENQLKNRELALSFSYSFYADTTDPMQYTEIKTVDDLKEKIEDSKKEQTLINRVIFSDAFAITIDLQKWTELVKEVDINESMPPVYAAIEVRCYDFYENLRPDLYLKIVEVSGISISDDKEITQSIKFYKKQPDINTHFIHFPYAIYIGTPLKYRITEIKTDGLKMVGDWQTTESCSSLIDVTTKADKLTFENVTYEIEINPEMFDKKGNNKLLLKISYRLNGKTEGKLLEFDATKTSLETDFYHDLNSDVQYQYELLELDTVVYKSDLLKMIDSYLYLNHE